MILCPRLTTTTPALRKALEGYIAAGGKLIQFKGDGLILKGSIIADHGFGDPSEHWEEVQKERRLFLADLSRSAMAEMEQRPGADVRQGFRGVDRRTAVPQQQPRHFLGVHKAGTATYLLFANNAQSKEDPRGVKAELVPAETTVTVPKGGVVYDLFNGGEVPVKDGKAVLRLAAGDGACWLHIPEPLLFKGMAWWLSDGPLGVHLRAKGTAALPFSIRIWSEGGQMTDQLFRASTPGFAESSLVLDYPVGSNSRWGAGRIEVVDNQTGKPARVVPVNYATTRKERADITSGPVSDLFRRRPENHRPLRWQGGATALRQAELGRQTRLEPRPQEVRRLRPGRRSQEDRRCAQGQRHDRRG